MGSFLPNGISVVSCYLGASEDLVSWCRNRFFLFLSLSSLTLVPHQQNGELSWVINEDRNCNKFAIGTALSCSAWGTFNLSTRWGCSATHSPVAEGE
jgi:hypothetical protein